MSITSPTDIAGCVIWNDAGNGFSSPTWSDLSGEGNDWTLGTPPTFVSNSFNGKPGLRFVNASAQYLQLAGAINVGTLFLVLSNFTTATHVCGNAGAVYADGAGFSMLTFNYPSTSMGTNTVGFPGAGEAAIVSITCAPFSNGARLTKNDAVCRGNVDTGTASLLYLGRYAGTTNEHLGADVMGVVGYSGGLSAGQHTQVVRLLARTHGITVNARVAATGRV